MLVKNAHGFDTGAFRHRMLSVRQPFSHPDLGWLALVAWAGQVFPRLRSVLCIGGVNTNEQMRIIRQGVHLMTATPGRINDMLTKKRFSLTQCRFLCSQTP